MGNDYCGLNFWEIDKTYFKNKNEAVEYTRTKTIETIKEAFSDYEKSITTTNKTRYVGIEGSD